MGVPERAQRIKRSIDEALYTAIPIVLDPKISPGDQLRINVFLTGKGFPRRNKLFITYNPQLLDKSDPGEVRVYIITSLGNPDVDSVISNTNPIAGVIPESEFRDRFSGGIRTPKSQSDAEEFFAAMEEDNFEDYLDSLPTLSAEEAMPPQIEAIRIPGTSIRFQRGLFHPFAQPHGDIELLPVASEFGLYVEPDAGTQKDSSKTQGNETDRHGDATETDDVPEVPDDLLGVQHAPIEIRIKTSEDCPPGDYDIPLTFTYTDVTEVRQSTVTPTVHVMSWYERNRAEIAVAGVFVGLLGLISLEALFNVVSNFLGGIG